MRRPFGIVWCLLLASSAAVCAENAPAGEPESKSGLSIVGKDEGKTDEDFRFQMGDDLPIRVTGELVKKVETEWGKTKSLVLYFDGERIAELKSPPKVVGPGRELLLTFPLARNAEDAANRQAWDRLFRKQRDYLMTIEPSLAIGSDLPLVVQSAHPFQFYVAKRTAVVLAILIGLVVFGVALFVVKRMGMLCDPDTNYFSLGKSQMAFWGLLVSLSFAGVWILTGTMERIPAQVLILLGISGATGLGAVVIGNSKKAGRLAELRQEEQKLLEQQASAPATFSQSNTDRLKEIKAEMGRWLAPGTSHGFWHDICDDGQGLSFHRLQVVIWTLILGAIFVCNVAQVMSMPEFSETLLTLMGISNGTYIGFKIPEKP